MSSKDARRAPENTELYLTPHSYISTYCVRYLHAEGAGLALAVRHPFCASQQWFAEMRQRLNPLENTQVCLMPRDTHILDFRTEPVLGVSDSDSPHITPLGSQVFIQIALAACATPHFAKGGLSQLWCSIPGSDRGANRGLSWQSAPCQTSNPLRGSPNRWPWDRHRTLLAKNLSTNTLSDPLPRIRRNWAPTNVFDPRSTHPARLPGNEGLRLVAVCQLVSHSLQEIIAIQRLVDG